MILEECYNQSIKLLLKNAGAFGLLASSLNKKSKEREYDYIFARDACISALGIIVSRNKDLLKIARKSLIALSKYQTKIGQIPYSVYPQKNKVIFYYLGCVDSTLWWLIALHFYKKYSGDKKLNKILNKKINLALSWLFHQDQNNCGLLEQGEASDWADLMPNNGIVLYTNALWHKVLDLYKFKKEKKLAYDGLNNMFLPFNARPEKSIYLQREKTRIKHLKNILDTTKKRPYYLNYISHQYGNDRCDVFGNLLAILFKISSKKQTDIIINFLLNKKINKPYPIIAIFPPIKKTDCDWRSYLLHKNLNLPNQYHNGGAWPFIGGFWIIALAMSGRKKMAVQELVSLAKTNKINNWQFNEWFNGKTGKPMGMPGQSWNAGSYLLAYHYIKGNFKL